MCVSNKYFEHKSLHKYTRVARGQDGVEAKNMIDLMQVMKDMLRYVKEMMAMRGMGRDLSNHHVVLCKVKLMGTCTRSLEVKGMKWM